MRLVRDEMDNYAAPPNEIRPTDKAPIVSKVSDGIAYESAKFGFKGFDGKGVIINARTETVAEKGMFKKHLVAGRCVVPASEYYEWREQTEAAASTKSKKPKKKKHFIKDDKGNILFFAGLYRDYDNEREFVIMTKEPTVEISKVHDRMPVILRIDQLEPWLNGTLSPEDLLTTNFNASVGPCDEPDDPETNQQLSLF
jgi:putative SOS response-associated peptidase YedK